MTKYIRTFVIGAAVTLSVAGSSIPAWAGQWQQLENGSWMYQQEEGYAYGWQMIDGYWNYLDEQTGVWNPRPTLTDEAASKMLWNELKKENLYQDERYEIVCKVDYSDKNTVSISVCTETGPNGFAVLNTFKVDRGSRIAKSSYSKTSYELNY